MTEKELYLNLMTIVDFFNDSTQDRALLQAAGIASEKNLLPIIARVGRTPDLTVSALARLIGRDHSATSRQVDRFVRLGYLKRNPDPKDRRATVIDLTPAGRALFEQIASARHDAMQAALLTLTPAAQSQLEAGVALAAKVLAKILEQQAQ